MGRPGHGHAQRRKVVRGFALRSREGRPGHPGLSREGILLNKTTLALEGVRAGYIGQLDVLKGIDLEVKSGEYVAIIGANGHGKTTILRTASGLLKPSAGKVSLDGEDITGMPAYKIAEKGLTHVPEGSRLFPQMTVQENLMAGAFSKIAWRARRKNMERVFRLFPNVSDRKGQLALTLSGGERQAVAIARGLMAENIKLLLIDEPSAGLAPLIIEEVYRQIAEIRKTGIGLLLVEQSPKWIADCDRIYLIENGEVRMQGTPKEVLESEQVMRAYLGG
jgi:branched-chain amino acid transport system ATP-binding protein